MPNFAICKWRDDDGSCCLRGKILEDLGHKCTCAYARYVGAPGNLVCLRPNTLPSRFDKHALTLQIDHCTHKEES